MDVLTTLDRQIQRMSERALEGIVERSAPESANITVIEIATGDILAMANAPTFNPNSSNSEAAPRKNHAVQDAIEPGSVFKPFTVAAAVEAGLVDEHTPIDCEGGVYRIGRTRIHDDHPHGVISISEVIKYSSNIGSAKLAMRMGASSFVDALRQFGFGERTGVPLPGERRGVIRDPRKIKSIELATTAFGQGVTSTSLQLAMATATLANGGVRMKPRLVTRVQDMHGIPEYVQRPEVAQRVVSRETAEATGRMMVTVTEPGGTATRAQVPGYKVAGKTGTAQKVKDGRYSAARIGSFVGYVPAEDPVIAIVVTVDEPTKGSRYGGIVAAPAFAEVAGGALRYLGIPPNPELLEPASDGELPLVEKPDAIRVAWTDNGWTLPDLTGRPLRDVLVGLQGTGLAVNPRGSGLAVSQSPAPGAVVAPGTPVDIAFQ
jgi:cell division protein FtsI (penicillin-binding protein 3)